MLIYCLYDVSEQKCHWLLYGVASQLNQKAHNALTSIKELINEADANSLNQQLALERDHFVKNLHHVNAGIGISAFLNKEKPRYE